MRKASSCASIAGEVFDVVVDLRESSPTFGRSSAMTLSAQNKRMLWVPPGIRARLPGRCPRRRSFSTRRPTTGIPEHERTLLWNDPALGIAWPLDGAPTLAAKDAAGTPLAHADALRVTDRRAARSSSPGREGRSAASSRRCSRRSGDVVAVDRDDARPRRPRCDRRVVRDVAPGARSSMPPPTRPSIGRKRERELRVRDQRACSRAARGGGEAHSARCSSTTRPTTCSTARSARRTTEDSPPSRLNVYGASKLEGERAIAAVGRNGARAPHELGVRIARKQFPAYHPPARGGARRAAHRRRPDRRAQLVARAGGCYGDADGAWPEICRRARGSLSSERGGANDLVRLRARNRRRRGTGRRSCRSRPPNFRPRLRARHTVCLHRPGCVTCLGSNCRIGAQRWPPA